MLNEPVLCVLVRFILTKLSYMRVNMLQYLWCRRAGAGCRGKLYYLYVSNTYRLLT